MRPAGWVIRAVALALLAPMTAWAQGAWSSPLPSGAPLDVTMSWGALAAGITVQTGNPDVKTLPRRTLSAPGSVALVNGPVFYLLRGKAPRESEIRVEIYAYAINRRMATLDEYIDATRPDTVGLEPHLARAEMATFNRLRHREATVGGRRAFEDYTSDRSTTTARRHFFVEVDARRLLYVMINGYFFAESSSLPLEQLQADYAAFVASVRFSAPDEAVPSGAPEETPEWKTATGGGDQPPEHPEAPRADAADAGDSRDVSTEPGSPAPSGGTGDDSLITPETVGGAAVVVVGVLVIAGGIAARFRRRKREWESEHGTPGESPPEDPNKTVGYVLQLSQDRCTLQPGASASITATVWAVNAQGATTLANAATIAVSAPGGLLASPQVGTGRLAMQLVAPVAIAPGTYTVVVTAQAGGTSHSATVMVTVGVASAYALRIDPPTLTLQQSQRTTIRARVVVSGADPDHCARETQRLAPAIQFSLSGRVADWFTTGERLEGDSKAGLLDLVIPEGASSRPGAHTAVYTAEVATPGGVLRQSCTITVSDATAYELMMAPRLRVQANDTAGTLQAQIRALDDSLVDAESVIASATARITFSVEGPHAHWLREEGGAPGMLMGMASGGATPAKEVHPLALVPSTDLSARGPFAATVTASVEIPRHGVLTQTTAVEIAPPEWFIEAVVTRQEMVLDGKDAAEFRVRLMPQQQHWVGLYGGAARNQLNELLRVQPVGAAAADTVLNEVSGAAGYRTFQIRYTPPTPDTAAEWIDLDITAEVTGASLTQPLRITLVGEPAIKVSVDSLLLKADGAPVTVTAEVVNPGVEQWKVFAALKDIDVVSKNDPPPDRKIAVVLTPGALDDSTPRAVGVLEFTAHSPTQALEPVSVPVTVQDEGLVLLTDPVTVLPDPKATKPGIVKLQVLRWNDELKRLTLDRAAMEAGITWGSFSAATYPRGERVFQQSGVQAEFQWFNGSGMDEYAVYRVRPIVPVPCDATAIDAKWSVSASASAWEADAFERELTVQFPADLSKAMEPRLAKELANCRKIILFLPDGHRRTWEQKILSKDAPLLGYHGLYRMRHQIWEEAREALLREAQAYLQDATYYDRVVVALDWAKWILDLAFQAVETIVVPFPGNLAVDQTRAFLTEYCVAACNDGTPVDRFAIQYFGKLYEDAGQILADLGVGVLLDLDAIHETLAKRYPTDPIKVAMATCEIFWVGTFVQFLTYKKNPQSGESYSIVEAFVEATRTLRDQVLVSMFSKKLKAKFPAGGSPSRDAGPAEGARKGTANEPGLPNAKPANDSNPTAPSAQKPSAAPVSAPNAKAGVAPEASSPATKTPSADAGADRIKETPPSLEERRGAWDDGLEEGRGIITQAHEAVASGEKAQIRDAALELQATKQGVYQINRDGTPQAKSTREVVKQELKEVYADADRATCADLAETLPPREPTGGVRTAGEAGDPPPKPTVRAKNITNTPKPGAPPKDPSKLSVDRDVTYERQAYPGELIPDPNTPGKFIKAKGDEWVDIPARESSEVYARRFKEAALAKASPEMQAKYKDMPPAEFAKRYDQTVTDRMSSDAYGRGPKDLETAVSNPGGSFSDPAGMGKTAEYKANEWYVRAEREAKTPAEREAFIAEGMRQTTKQFGNQVEGRLEVLNKHRGEGSANPSLQKVEPPPALQLGIETLRKVDAGTMSPADADAALKRMGMTKESVAQDLGDFLARIYRMPVTP